MKIRFCENNDGSRVTFRRLLAECPELDIKRKKCLKNCGACKSSLFALVDGMVLRGKNPDELYLKVQELLKAE